MRGELSSAADESGVLPPLRRGIAFSAMIAAIGAVVMDNVAATLALPTIARHYGLTPSESIWVVNVYQLVLVVCLLPLAALADKYGYRRVYIGGLVLFAATAVLSALAPSFTALTLSRAAQGVAAAAILSVNLALIRRIFPERRLGSALGINATAGAIAIAAGPSIAGFLIEFASWQWIFAIAAPTTATAALISHFALPRAAGRDIPFDLPSAILSALTFGGLLLGIGTLGRAVHPILAGIELAVGVAAGIALVLRLRGRPDPLVPLDLLRIPAFAFSVAASVCTFCAQMLAFVTLPFLMQGAFGFSAVEAGLAFSARPIALASTAALSGVLADRLPQGVLCAIGLSLLAAGLMLLAALPGAAGRADLIWRLALCGIGFALFQTPNNRILLGSSPRTRATAASAALGTTRLLGQALGAAMAALVLGTAGAERAEVGLWIGSGFALAGAAVSALRYRTPGA